MPPETFCAYRTVRRTNSVLVSTRPSVPGVYQVCIYATTSGLPGCPQDTAGKTLVSTKADKTTRENKNRRKKKRKQKEDGQKKRKKGEKKKTKGKKEERNRRKEYEYIRKRKQSTSIRKRARELLGRVQPPGT